MLKREEAVELETAHQFYGQLLANASVFVQIEWTVMFRKVLPTCLAPLGIASLCFVKKIVLPQSANLPHSCTQHSTHIHSIHIHSKSLMTNDSSNIKIFRWGTHLYISLFPSGHLSVRLSICRAPYFRNCTSCDHYFW